MTDDTLTNPLLTELNIKLWGRRFLEMLETVSLITIILGKEGRILFANAFLLNLTGWKMEEIAEKKWLDLFIPEEIRAQVQRVFDDSIRGEKIALHYENEILTRGGERRIIRWSNTWLRDAEGKIEGTASIGEDITDRKRAEEKVLSHERRLRSLAEDLARTEDRERMRLAALLHEGAAQSLAVAKMEAYALSRQQSPIDAQAVQNLQQHIDESISQVRDLMCDLSPPSYVFKELTRALLWVAKNLSTKYRVDVRIVEDHQPKPLEDGTKALVISALRELITNSVKHGKAAHIEVDLRRTGSTLNMTVTDDGVGFCVPELGEYFDATGGFGLFNLLERLMYVGGTFTIRSQIGRGTEATVVAPLAREE